MARRLKTHSYGDLPVQSTLGKTLSLSGGESRPPLPKSKSLPLIPPRLPPRRFQRSDSLPRKLGIKSPPIRTVLKGLKMRSNIDSPFQDPSGKSGFSSVVDWPDKPLERTTSGLPERRRTPWLFGLKDLQKSTPLLGDRRPSSPPWGGPLDHQRDYPSRKVPYERPENKNLGSTNPPGLPSSSSSSKISDSDPFKAAIQRTKSLPFLEPPRPPRPLRFAGPKTRSHRKKLYKFQAPFPP